MGIYSVVEFAENIYKVVKWKKLYDPDIFPPRQNLSWFQKSGPQSFINFYLESLFCSLSKGFFLILSYLTQVLYKSQKCRSLQHEPAKEKSTCMKMETKLLNIYVQIIFLFLYKTQLKIMMLSSLGIHQTFKQFAFWLAVYLEYKANINQTGTKMYANFHQRTYHGTWRSLLNLTCSSFSISEMHRDLLSRHLLMTNGIMRKKETLLPKVFVKFDLQ